MKKSKKFKFSCSPISAISIKEIIAEDSYLTKWDINCNPIFLKKIYYYYRNKENSISRN